MTIQQLTFFITVSECGQFTSAANELYISQSSLSKQIISLEKELGIKLFERNTRNLTLTPAGSKILKQANIIVDQYNQINAEVAGFRQSEKKKISFGAPPILNFYGFTEDIVKFRQSNPEILVDVVETSTGEILEMLDQHKIDIGLIRTAHLHDSCYNIIPILEDEQILLVSEQHPLSEVGEVSLRLFENDNFMLMNTDAYYTQYYLKLLRDAEINPPVQLTRMRLATIKVCVMENTCVSLMMNEVARHPLTKGTRILRIQGHPSLYLAFVMRKGEKLAKGTEDLINLLLNEHSDSVQKKKEDEPNSISYIRKACLRRYKSIG